jgi:hypothetical protein
MVRSSPAGRSPRAAETKRRPCRKAGAGAAYTALAYAQGVAELPFPIIAAYIVNCVYAGAYGTAGPAHHARPAAPAADPAVSQQATGVPAGTVAADLLRYAVPSATDRQFLNYVTSLHNRVEKRAKEISAHPLQGELDSWRLAEREVLTPERAAEIGRGPEPKGNWDNWLRAELEVVTAQRARTIASDPRRAGSDLENWIEGEREARIAICAEDIHRKKPRGNAQEDWLEAERQLGLRQ